MMEALGLYKLVEDMIIAQQHSKSTFVPFRNMVTQRPPITPAPRTAPIKNFFEADMQAHKEKGIFIIVIRNSPRDINVLSKRYMS